MVQRLLGPKSAGDIMAMKPALRVGTKRDMEIGFPKKVEVSPSELMVLWGGGVVGSWDGQGRGLGSWGGRGWTRWPLGYGTSSSSQPPLQFTSNFVNNSPP